MIRIKSSLVQKITFKTFLGPLMSVVDKRGTAFSFKL